MSGFGVALRLRHAVSAGPHLLSREGRFRLLFCPEVDSRAFARDFHEADRCKRERPAWLAPKEQPPRKLSGKRTAAQTALWKAAARIRARLTEGVIPERPGEISQVP